MFAGTPAERAVPQPPRRRQSSTAPTHHRFRNFRQRCRQNWYELRIFPGGGHFGIRYPRLPTGSAHDETWRLSWVATSELRRLATATTPWNYYLATEVYISAPEIAGVVRPVFNGGFAEPPFGPLHVVSATQPGSDPDSYENVERLAVLDRELQDLGIESVPALGRSFDGKHQEQSRAVFGLDDIAARALGARFGQVAIFSWKGPWWSLLACTDARTERQAWRWEPASSDR